MSTTPSLLRQRIEKVIAAGEHREIFFENVEDVPVGSAGTFVVPGSHTQIKATRTEKGWRAHMNAIVEPPAEWSFLSHSGPANDAKLAELLETEIIPKHSIIGEFTVAIDNENDYELGYSVDYGYLSDGRLIGSSLTERETLLLGYGLDGTDVNEGGGIGGFEASIRKITDPLVSADREKRNEQWIERG